MEKRLSRVISLLLAIVMLASLMPVSVHAAEAEDTGLTMSVSSVSGMPGDTVQVQIVLKNNPGLASMKFYVDYNEEVLTLTDVKLSTAFGSYITTPTPYKSHQPITLISPLADVSAEGVLATLTFVIAEDAKDNIHADVTVSFKQADVFNAEYEVVPLTVENGCVEVHHGIPGDINNDREVNTKDAILLFRYIAEWDVDVDTDALDVNGDNAINTKDAITLFRYIAEWPGITLHRGKVCTHELTHVAAQANTCDKEGNIEYWLCNLCGRVYKDADCQVITTLKDTVLSAIGHKYVDGTCQNCGEEIGPDDYLTDELGHQLTYYPAEKSTCSLHGYAAHLVCETCNKLYNLNLAEVTKEDLTLPLAPHALTYYEEEQPGEKCYDVGHIACYVCEACEHIYLDAEGTVEIKYEDALLYNDNHADIRFVEAWEGNCEEPGNIACYVCWDCESVFSDANGENRLKLEDVLIYNYNHTIVYVEAKQATCLVAGNLAHYTCTVCDRIFADKNGEKELSSDAVILSSLAHNLEDGVCTSCGVGESTAGLEFELNEDGNSYTLIGMGDCTDKEIYVGLYNGMSVTAVGMDAFWNKRITSITLDACVTRIESGAFMGCQKLATITMTDNVTYIGSNALCDTAITSFTVPAGVTRLEDFMFQNCASLTELHIGANVCEIADYAFYGIGSVLLSTITVDPANTVYVSINNTLIDTVRKILVRGNGSGYIPDDGSVTVIGSDAFYGISLESITVPNGIVEIKDEAFAFSALTSIYLPESVTVIGSTAFMGCQMDRIEIDKNNPVLYTGTNCIINRETKTLILGLSGCVIPSDGSVTAIGDYAFQECANLTEIVIPDTITHIGMYAFSFTDLTSITIPESVVYLGYGAFNGCWSLTTAKIFANISVIEGWTFGNCSNLTSVILPANLESLQYNAFYNCSNLKEVTLPASLTYIHSRAFANCKSLVKINYYGTEKQFEALGYPIPEGATIVYEYGVHSLVYYPATPAGCTTPGSKEYYYCEKCNHYFSDKDGKKEVLKGDLEIPASGHNFVDGACTVCGSAAAIDWNGKTLNVFANQWYSTTGAWAPVELWVTEYGQSALHDAILNRAAYIEETYNITMKWTGLNATKMDAIASAIDAGTKDYDLWLNKILICQGIVANGYVYDLADSEYIDFSKSYYSQLGKEAFTVAGHTFFATGDFNYIAYEITYLWLVNNEIAESIVGFPEDIYETVRDGEWTLDLAFELAAKAAADLNNDGIMDSGDAYGFCTNSLGNWYNYCGVSSVVVNDGKYEVGLSDHDKINSVIDYAIEMMTSGWFCNLAWLNGSTLFNEGRCLFFQEVVNGMSGYLSANPDLYIVPNPKFDANDDIHYTTGAYNQANSICIPKCTQDSKMSEYFFEVLFATASEQIIPKYLEERLINLNPDNYKDVEDMILNYIFPGALYDVGYQTYEWSTVCGSIMNPSINNKVNTFASDYAINIKTAQAIVDSWNEAWANYVEDRCDHEKVFASAKKATCTEEGYVAHYFCKLCGKYFDSKDPTREISRKEIILSKIAHNYVDDTCTVCGAGRDNAWQGKTLNVFANQWYSTTGAWAPVELWVTEYGQSALHDAILNRAAYIEETYNITMKWTGLNATKMDAIASAMDAGTKDYDLWVNKMLICNAIVANGYVYDLAGSEYIDFSKSYYSQLAKDAFTVQGHTFFAMGDFNYIAYEVTYLWWVNADFLADVRDIDLYETVREGKWTLDLAFEIAAEAGEDINGDGIMDAADQYGLVTGTPGARWYHFCGISSVVSKDGKYEIGLNDTARVNSAISYALRMLSSDWYTSTAWQDGSSIFREGRALFMQEIIQRFNEYLALDFNLYSVPNPKLDVNDEYYYTSGAFNQANSICIPKCTQDREMSEYFFEVLFKTGSEMIMPYYLDAKLVDADPDNYDDYVDMVTNYILPGCLIDVGVDCYEWTTVAGNITNPSLNNRVNTFAADYEANIDAAQATVDSWNANWASYVDNSLTDSEGHRLTYYPGQEATCFEFGFAEHWSCYICDKWYDKALNEISKDDILLAPSHSPIFYKEEAPLSCAEPGHIACYVCDNCERIFLDKECTKERKLEEVLIYSNDHTIVFVDARKATCSEPGNIACYVCEECESIFADEKCEKKLNLEDVLIYSNDHSLVHVDAKDATCAVSGNVEYYKCENCDSVFLDKDGKNPTTLESVTVPTTDHTMVDGSCSICGLHESTEDLEFQLNPDGQSYTLIGIGSCPGGDIYVGLYNGLPVTAIGQGAFQSNRTITGLTLGACVTRIEIQAFFGCSKLATIRLTDNVTYLGSNAFCRNPITSFTVPAGVTQLPGMLFQNCTDLTEVVIHANVNYIDSNAFRGCNNLERIIVAEENPIYASINDTLVNVQTGVLLRSNKAGYIPDDGSVTVIGANALQNCEALTELYIPDTITRIDFNAFVNCRNLSYVYVPASVIQMDASAFTGCPIANIDIAEDNPIFCAGEKCIINKATNTLFKGFAGCVIPDDGSVTAIGNSAFESCEGLSEIVIPNTITSIGRSAFAYTELVSIDLPNSITSIGYAAFEGCNQLKTVKIPGEVTVIEGWTFGNCGKLVSVILPDNLEQIDGNAFVGCSALTEITLPTTLKRINAQAFTDCSALVRINYCGSEEQFAKLGFSVPNSVKVIYNYGNHTAVYHPAEEATCTTPGYKEYYYCEKCNHYFTDKECKNEVFASDVMIPALGHNYVDGTCTVCGNEALVTSKGLEFQLNKDGKSYTWIGLGSCTDTEIVVDTYMGLPVTTVGSEVLGWNNRTVTSVVLGESVTTIENNAFYGSWALSSITMTDKVTTIRSNAFCGTLITSFAVPAGITRLDDWGIFQNCSNLKEIVFHSGVTYINGGIFSGCSSLENIVVEQGNANYYVVDGCLIERNSHKLVRATKDAVIPADGSVTVLGNYSFSPFVGLNIEIPNTVERIESNAFCDCHIVSIFIPASVSYIDSYAFQSATIESIAVDEKNPTYAYISGCFINRNTQTLVLGIGNCTIPADGSVTSIGQAAFANNYSLTALVIPDTVTTIGRSAFEGCNNLQSIVLPSGLARIEEWTFNCCFNLTEITIPTSVTYIGNYAFQSCESLTAIIIPGSVETVGRRAFSNCRSLAAVIVLDGVTTIEDGAFNSCQSLETVTLPASLTSVAWNVFQNCYNLKTIRYAGTIEEFAALGLSLPEGVQIVCGYGDHEIIFMDAKDATCDVDGNVACYTCTKCGEFFSDADGKNLLLKSQVIIKATGHVLVDGACTSCGATEFESTAGLEFQLNGDGQSYTLINGRNCREANVIIDLYNGLPVTGIADWAFQNNQYVETVTLGNHVREIYNGAFAECRSLRSISLNQVTHLGATVFNGCSALESIVIPEGVSELGNQVLGYCTSLREVTIPASVTYVDPWTFYGSGNIEFFYIAEGNEVYCVIGNSLVHKSDKLLVRGTNNTVIPDDGSVLRIGGFVFSGCEKLTSLVIPEGIIEIGDRAFAECSNLTSIHLPSTIQWVSGNTFAESSIQMITVAKDHPFIVVKDGNLINTDSKTLLVSMSGTIPTDGSVTIIGSYAFASNGRITSLVIPDCIEGIESEAFHNCYNLQSVVIPDTVTYIGSYAFSQCNSLQKVTLPAGLVEISSGLFEGCGNLTKVNIPENVSYIRSYAFAGCWSLTNITLPAGLKEISWGAFQNCNNLREITIPAGVTRIESNTFRNCHALTSVVIPTGVTFLGDQAFAWCENLQKIVIPGTVTDAEWNVLNGCNRLQTVQFLGTEEQFAPIRDRILSGLNVTVIYGCEEHTMVELAAKDASCTEKGNLACYQCTTCLKYFEDAEGSIELSASQVVLPVSHNLVEVAATEATCNSTGMMAHYFCKDCMKLFSPNGDKLYVDGYVNELAPGKFERLLRLTGVPSAVFAYDAKAQTYVTTIGNTVAFFAATKSSEIEFRNVQYNGIGKSFFVANFYDAELILVDVSDLEEGTAYKFGTYNANYGSMYYVTGTINYNRLATTNNAIKAADVYVQFVDGGIRFYMINPDGLVEVSKEELVLPAGTHTMVDGACTSCGATEFESTAGLEFQLNEDGMSYTLINGRNCREANVIIDLYNGLPVTGIAAWAFESNQFVETVTIGNHVTSIYDGAFSNCRNLRSVSLNQITYLGATVFNGCSALESIVIPEGVSELGDQVLGYCASLREVTIPASVTYVDPWAFYCSGNIESFYVAEDNANYCVIGNSLVHKNDKLLVRGTNNTVIPDDGSVLRIGSFAFSGCEELTSLVIPEGITEIGDRAFADCPNLTSIHLPSTVQRVSGNTFAESSIQTITVAENHPFIIVKDGCLVDTDSKTLLVSMNGTIPTDGSVHTIGSYAFANNGTITSLVIPDCIECIASEAFQNCYNLRSVVIPDTVKSIGSYAFAQCTSLQKVTLPVGLVEISSGLFEGCRSLKEISIPATVNYIGGYAFMDCDGLTSIALPADLTKISWGAFQNCDNLREITIPAGVTRIESSTFRYCRALTTVVIPTRVTYIGSQAFAWCENLQKIVIPGTVTDAEWNVLNGCNRLQTVQFLGSEEDFASIRDRILSGLDVTVIYGCEEHTLTYLEAKEANCYEAGNLACYVCTTCSKCFEDAEGSTELSASQVFLPYSHNLVEVAAIEATCSATGMMAHYFCKDCMKIFSPNGDKLYLGAYMNEFDNRNLKWSGVSGAVFAYDSKAQTYVTTLNDIAVFFAASKSIEIELINVKYSAIGKNWFVATFYDENLNQVGVDELKEGTAYKFGTYNANYGSTYYITGDVTDVRLLTTLNPSKAADVYVQFVDGGLHIYMTNPDGLVEVSKEELVLPAGSHTMVDGACSVCGRVESTAGLEFELNNDGKSYTLINGQNCTEANVVIDLYNGLPVTEIRWSAFNHNQSIQSVVIGSDVRTIQDSAFNGCMNLTSVTLSEGLTSIWSNAFCNTGIAEITLPESLIQISDFAFSECKNLTSFHIPSNVREMSGGVLSGTNVTSITVSKKNPYLYVQDNCLILAKDGAYVLVMGNANSVIPYGVTAIGPWAFYYCKDLTKIVIPDSVTHIDHAAFAGCHNLKSVTMSKNIQVIGYRAFEGCMSLETIELPSTLTQIEGMAFRWCNSLTEIAISAGVTYIGDEAFTGCTVMGSITVDEGNEYYYASGNCLIAYDTQALLFGCSTSVIPEGVTVIANSAFAGQEGITSIVIPEGVTAIGEEAFSACTNLVSVTLPSTMRELHANAFVNCHKLEEINLPEGLTKIGEQAFASCNSLASMTIPSTVTEFGTYAFGWCNSLTSVVIPEGVTKIPEGTFYGCENLESVTIPSTVQTIGYMAFTWCNSLTEIVIPEGVTKLDKQAFSCCQNLKSVTLPSSLVAILDSAFMECPNLTDVYYLGTAEQFTAISSQIPSGATVHYGPKPETPETHEMVQVAAIAATCTTVGSRAYWLCMDCNKCFIDEEGTTELSANEIMIPAFGHSMVNGICQYCGVAD